VLLAAGADVHARDQDGRTALHSALCNADAAKALLAAGAEVNAADFSGNTPIGQSVSSDVATVLWRAGADMSLLDSNGRHGWANRLISVREWFETQFEPIFGRACIYI
jgi:ankyrin repeat protein